MVPARALGEDDLFLMELIGWKCKPVGEYFAH